jgi:transcriptional regulator with XRE-family HTH domain
MFQPGGSNDTGSETGVAARKPARPAPVVDETLRAGAKLAQARQMLGLTLDEIADRTKVRRDYLEAIEAMNVKFLPGRAYTVPYVKSYAQLVGLDPQALIGQFLRESALAREDAQPQLRNPESKPRRERPWLMALLVAFAAAGFLGWQAVKDRAAETRTAAAQPAAPRANPAPAPDASSPIVADPVAPAGIAPVIELTATEPAWLEVRGPEGTIFLSRDLKPGDRYRPDVGVGWTLHAKDGGAFAVTIDGRPVGVLGEKGSPVLGRHVDTMAEAMHSPPPVAATPSQG